MGFSFFVCLGWSYSWVFRWISGFQFEAFGAALFSCMFWNKALSFQREFYVIVMNGWIVGNLMHYWLLESGGYRTSSCYNSEWMGVLRKDRDEGWYCLVWGKMSKASLGLRSLSFGSLQQQTQNGGLFYQNSSGIRKTSRTLSGSREKEKYLQFILKYLARRKVIMLILVTIATLAISTGFFNTNRGLICCHWLLFHFASIA